MHPRNDILEQLRQLASDVLGVPAGQLSDASGPESIAAWDSVQHLSLVLAVEQHFGVQFDPDEIEGTATLGAIAAAVAVKLGAA